MKHRTYKYKKYGAVIAAGMLLMALPMTVMAQKNTEAAAVELETTTEDSTKALRSADREEAANSENTAAGKGEDNTTSIVTEDKTKTSEITKAADETKSSETAKDAEEETVAAEKSTEDVVEDAAAAEENGTESKSETETETATEAEIDAEAETAAETEIETTAAETSAELKSEDELISGIIGTWSVDESTGLSFGENNKGKLLIPDEEYAFSYKIDGDQLILNFVSSKATDGTYTASLSGDTLTLIGGKGTIGGTFELNRSK